MIFIKGPKANECPKASEARRSPWRRRGQGSFASVTFCKGKNLAGRGSANKKILCYIASNEILVVFLLTDCNSIFYYGVNDGLFL
jgi:hypothetical protein